MIDFSKSHMAVNTLDLTNNCMRNTKKCTSQSFFVSLRHVKDAGTNTASCLDDTTIMAVVYIATENCEKAVGEISANRKRLVH